MSNLTAPYEIAQDTATADTANTYAALDLGSNSFHLIVARDNDGSIQVIDKHREMIRVAAGLESTGYLSAESIERALECLNRISQRLRNLPHRNVRVVGTNALRQARNRDEFINQAESILGHDVDVISGREEGRLIYAAVAHSIESRSDRRLVIDIGGGSTEFIAGHRFEPHLTESLHIGCISMTERWFKNGEITAKGMTQAIQDVRRELEVIEHNYRAHGWDLTVGTSGTMLAIQNAISQFTTEGITASTLKELTRRLVAFGHVDNIDPAWCASRRAQSLPGGIAILRGAFKSLKIKQFTVSNDAMREGLLHDLLGRAQNDDIRERTVRGLIPRFHIDQHHATLVANTALTLFDSIYPDPDGDLAEERLLLRWAAMLHEIGMNVSHIAYHKHGAYLLEHLDVPGFALTEQEQLGWLVRSHRRRIVAEDHMPHNKSLNHLCVLLRLAVTLRRNRADDRLPKFELRKHQDEYDFRIEKKWLDKHPLTQMDLAQESQYLEETGVKLNVVEL